MHEEHPFDRYAEYTDLAALKEFSARSLRRSIRVNTLLSSAPAFQEWAAEKRWKIDPVPWCTEGYFIDREDRSVPLGKDLLHLLGHFYFQEASSMLPVELLAPEPGEVVLDMAAAPGSKTTQIAAKLAGRGVVVANDMEERRIRTLKDALNRSCVTNVIQTKKVGQWFAKHMTGRFDRVLIDAPCTAQGTARKDPEALMYCSEHSIRKSAALQRELLEAAVHAAKIGGRIVYSTCTLTPEENEEVAAGILNKFCDQLIALDPREILPVSTSWDVDRAIEDSLRVQGGGAKHPFLRIWPQAYDTEGFFCAVFQKTGPTRDIERVEWLHFREEPLPGGQQQEIASFLHDRYGTEILREGERLWEKGDHLVLTTDTVSNFRLPVTDYCLGLPFGRRLRDIPVYIDHEIAVLRGSAATQNFCTIGDAELATLFTGQDTACPESLSGHVLVRYRDWCIGRGRARNGMLKNHLPRWMVYQMQDVVSPGFREQP